MNRRNATPRTPIMINNLHTNRFIDGGSNCNISKRSVNCRKRRGSYSLLAVAAWSAVAIASTRTASCTVRMSTAVLSSSLTLRVVTDRTKATLIRNSFFCSPQSRHVDKDLLLRLRGGGGSVDEGLLVSPEIANDSDNTTPLFEFAHGTTTLSFKFRNGIVVAVDSRASLGQFVGSKTVQKVLPISQSMLGTMAGGAADCYYWIRKLRSEARKYRLSSDNGGEMSVARASKWLSQMLYANRQLQLSVGTMIMGISSEGTSEIYYVDQEGARIKGDMFAVGSGATFALGVLDTESTPLSRHQMSQEEAITLAIKAIRHATYRDAYSGGYIGVYVISTTSEDKREWQKVFSQDLATVRL